MINEWITFPSGKRICRKHHKIKCDECTDTSISHGNKKPKKVRSKKFHSKSQSNHSKSQRVVERFHSYRVKFLATIQWDLVKGRIINLNNNVCYKRLDFDVAFVQVFKKSIFIVLRASKDIKGLPISDAKKVADSLFKSVLDRLPKAIVVDVSKVSSCHNAFMNHPTANYGVNVSVDGVKRLISDHSKGRLEFEAIDPLNVVSDSEVLECWNKDLITNPFDVASVTKSKLDTILKVQLDYANNIVKHLKVQDKTLETLQAIKDAQVVVRDSPLALTSFPLPSQSENVGRGSNSIVLNNDMFVSLPTISKYDSRKVKALKFKRWYE